MEGRRRLISFDRDIAEDVAKKSGGKFTKEQVDWCIKASASYIHHLLRYTDVMVARIPYLGDMVCNMREMRVRRDKLKRVKSKIGGEFEDPRYDIEIMSLDRKLEEYKDLMTTLKRGDPFISDNHERLYQNRRGYSFEEIQDFQQLKFE